MRKKREGIICDYCVHYKAEYAPYIKRMVMTCELPSRNPMCHGNYERKRDNNNDNDNG